MSRSTAARSTTGDPAPQGGRNVGARGKDEVTDRRRLVYAPSDEFDRWQCRPLGTIDVLDLQDRKAGHLDGLVIDRLDDRPVYLAVANARLSQFNCPTWLRPSVTQS